MLLYISIGFVCRKMSCSRYPYPIRFQKATQYGFGLCGLMLGRMGLRPHSKFPIYELAEPRFNNRREAWKVTSPNNPNMQ